MNTTGVSFFAPPVGRRVLVEPFLDVERAIPGVVCGHTVAHDTGQILALVLLDDPITLEGRTVAAIPVDLSSLLDAETGEGPHRVEA